MPRRRSRGPRHSALSGVCRSVRPVGLLGAFVLMFISRQQAFPRSRRPETAEQPRAHPLLRREQPTCRLLVPRVEGQPQSVHSEGVVHMASLNNKHMAQLSEKCRREVTCEKLAEGSGIGDVAEMQHGGLWRRGSKRCRTRWVTMAHWLRTPPFHVRHTQKHFS